MSVVQLVEYSCKETTSILKVLLTMAIRGQLRGLVLCYRTDDGKEETVFTGVYKAHPNRAAEAGLRLSLQMMRANGDVD